MDGLTLLNFGCGSIQPAGWTNVDRTDFGQTWTADAATGRLPFRSGAFDGAVCSHSLQENTYDELPVVLGELRRVLRPGGVLRVLWPDVAAVVAAWQRGDRAWFPINDNEPALDDAFCCYLNWFGTARTLCTEPRLFTLLARAGFAGVARMDFGRSRLPELATLDDREPEEQLIMEATAP
jgi:predicted SAM-dependent methyltransferase